MKNIPLLLGTVKCRLMKGLTEVIICIIYGKKLKHDETL